MGDSAPHLQGLLSTLHGAGAGPRERLRLHRAEALARRIAAIEGPARALLEGRLQQLLQDPSPPGRDGGSQASTSITPAPALAGLTRLLEDLRSRSGAHSAGAVAHVPKPDFAGDRACAIDAHSAALPALEAARQTWAQLRMDDHLRHVMAEVPDDAGPMHSTVLVHRAIAVMHEAAPGYLQHFLGYADALAVLERYCPAPASVPPARAPRPRPPGPGTATARATPRSRPRGKRRPA